MTYKDYYLILEINFTADQIEIKKKYKQLVKKWHPDLNKDRETTSIMQDITEAYLILSDVDARIKYNKIYESYFKKKAEFKNNDDKKSSKHSDPKSTEKDSHTYNEKHSINDPELDNWIRNANKQAREYVFQSVKDIKGITFNVFKYTLYSIGLVLVIFTLYLIIILISKTF